MSRLERLAEQAEQLSLSDAPRTVAERLRLQSLSVLGATAAGASAPDVAPVLRLAAAEGLGDLPVVPGQPRLDLDSAFSAAAALSVALDYDDYLLCGHTGHTAHWAAWRGGAALDRPWTDVLNAQLAANELMGRLGGMCLAGRQNGQAWAFLHAFGGALVGGLLRRLPPHKLAHALAIALSRAPYVDWKLFGSGAKVLVAGEPLRAGWRAAALAEAGLEGPLDILEPGSDFLAIFADGRPLDGWLTGIGEAWLTETLTYKLVPGCAYLGSALEALSELLIEVEEYEGRILGIDDVLRIDVDAGLLTAAMELLLGGDGKPPRGGPDRFDPVGVGFSVARSLSLLLARGGALDPSAFERTALDAAAEAAGDLPRRIHVHHDWRMTLTAWARLKEQLGMDQLLAGLGPSTLLATLSRARRTAGSAGARDGVAASGPPGGGTGLAWSELPLALAQERLEGIDSPLPAVQRLGGELTREPGKLLGRGLNRLAGMAGAWAGDKLNRLMRPPFDLAHYDLHGVGLPVPVRVKLLENGGRVWEAERIDPGGSPARPIAEVREGVRGKFLRESLRVAPNRPAPMIRLADALVTEGGDLPQLMGGPGEFLAAWAKA